MKNVLYILLLATMLLSSCNKTDDDKAKPLLAKIDSLYKAGEYSVVLDSITRLRDTYPKAIEARKAALAVWQNASLKLAQEEVAKTDVMLQQTESAIKEETDLYRRNMLGVKRDSLKARYEAMCGVVRMIRKHQNQH